jgi:hypothetical protein
MAEIKIEKKKPIWPWLLLGALILALVIWLVVDDDDDLDELERVDTTEMVGENNEGYGNEDSYGDNGNIGTDEDNRMVDAYVNFVDNDPDKMGLDHEFTNEALTKLIYATKSIAADIGYDIETDITKAQKLADKIKVDPFETTHANSIREVADILSNTLHNLQKEKYPSLSGDINNLKNAASKIKPDTLTLDQKQDVKGFFAAAADLLRKMN